MFEPGTSYGYEKYSRPEDDEEEKDTSDLDHDKEVERLEDMFNDLKVKLLPETQTILSEIIKKIKGSYDPDNEEWSELRTDVEFLLSEFEDSADADEREQSEIDAEEELRNLLQKTESLAPGKKTIH